MMGFWVRARIALGLAVLLAATSTPAIEVTESAAEAPRLFRDARLQIAELGMPVAQQRDAALSARAAALGSATTAQIDLRTGRFISLMPSVPLLPGRGIGNRLAATTPTSTQAQIATAAWQALRSWLQSHEAELALNVDELVDVPRITVVNPDYIQVYSPRRVDGVLVRDAMLTATIKYGNLILLGTSQWGNIVGNARASLSHQDAQLALARHAQASTAGADWKQAELAWLPLALDDPGSVGLEHRLVWVLRTRFGEADGRYESLVDAHSGQVWSIQDSRHMLETPRNVEGGVFPVSNDGVAPDGIEQTDWPLPFLRVTTPLGIQVSDIGGELDACIDGNISAALAGPYVTIADNCGASNLSGSGNLDFGSSGGTDCTTPGIGGAGNTHAARSGYFELNMIKAMGRGQLPNNTWLRGPLTATMNVQQTCNAGWDGVGVNFFRSGGGCNNTGEIAGVFDHEWGHGMDNNDGVPTVSWPGEGIADIYASLRLNTSCIGRNFRTTQCTGFGNACTDCTGVRDIDWAKHANAAPFTMADADACAPGNSNGPCGGSVHCEGQVYAQAVWDLWNRDLTSGAFGFSRDVSRELATQLSFRGSGGVGTWFACTAGSGGCGNPAGCGCAASAGYPQYLAADDDNGSLADGTPHMQAIFDAFNRHGIACTTPALMTQGCAATPTGIPLVTATPLDSGVSLNWTTSAGATGYRVYRTDSVFGCDFGKELLATVNGTFYIDLGLKNSRDYHYMVVPMGAADECMAVSSACTSSAPVPGGSLSVLTAQAGNEILDGDADPFVDNCEVTRMTLPFSNTGTAAMSNVRILAISSPTHPATEILSPLPIVVAASQPSCGLASGSFDFRASELDQGDEIRFDIVYTSDELGALTQTATVVIGTTESNLQSFASKTFTFDVDREGWTTTSGSFERDTAAGGGAGTPASAGYLRSSSFLDNQCDAVESPVLVLAADSTMVLSSRFNTEGFSGGQWWDRANISLRPLGADTRTLLTPSSGRSYAASGVGSACGTEGQAGWAGVADSWASSNWNATALQAATFANQPIRLELRYATDSSVNNFGFRFDELTLTNVSMAVADTQSNSCAAIVDDVFANGFE